MFPVRSGDRNLTDARGLMVVGTHVKCGKTIACAGLAGVLNTLGFTAQAIKPLNFEPAITIRKGYEQAYFDRLVGQPQPVEVLSRESAHGVSVTDWQRWQEMCRKRVYPYVLEAPGRVASPLSFTLDGFLDAVDLAKGLEIPIVLVTSKQVDLSGALSPALAYLEKREAEVIGWLAVETAPIPTPDWDFEVLFVQKQSQLPYLGEIAYSPSISVETLQQGNLLRTTEMGVDLLPIQQALNLLIPF